MTAFTQDLAKFIREHLLRESDPGSLDEHESLIRRGVIDSMGLMQVVTFIEERTGVRVPDDEVLPENFDSIQSIARMVHRLRDGRKTSG